MTRLERFILSLMFALLVAGVTLVVASAQTPNPENPVEPTAQQGTTESKCGTCHPDFQNTWFTGAHGHASSDPVFTESWASQGKPGACLVCHVTGYDPATATWQQDGVSCEACHGPAPADHPNEPMPVYRTADLCGRCHSDTRFGWSEWKVSAHYQRDMTCTVCHDPNSASLKTIEGKFGQAMETHRCRMDEGGRRQGEADQPIHRGMSEDRSGRRRRQHGSVARAGGLRQTGQIGEVALQGQPG